MPSNGMNQLARSFGARAKYPAPSMGQNAGFGFFLLRAVEQDLVLAERPTAARNGLSANGHSAYSDSALVTRGAQSDSAQ